MILDAVALAFWPFVGLMALTYFVIIRKSEYRIVFAVLVPATLIFPFAFFLSTWGYESMAFVVDYDVGFVALGAFFLCLSWVGDGAPEALPVDQPATGWLRPQSLGKRIAMVFYALFGAGLFGYGGWCLVGDYVVPRYVVEGRIEDLHWKFASSRLPQVNLVRIGDQDYKAPTRTFNALRIGDKIRAEVGRGSSYIFRVESLGGEGARR